MSPVLQSQPEFQSQPVIFTDLLHQVERQNFIAEQDEDTQLNDSTPITKPAEGDDADVEGNRLKE